MISRRDKYLTPLRAIIIESHAKTCQHASAGRFLEGQKYRSQVTRDCSVAEKWLSRLDALQFVQLRRLIFFFFPLANLKDERDTFVQQMIGVQKFMWLYYYIVWLGTLSVG